MLIGLALARCTNSYFEDFGSFSPSCERISRPMNSPAPPFPRAYPLSRHASYSDPQTIWETPEAYPKVYHPAPRSHLSGKILFENSSTSGTSKIKLLETTNPFLTASLAPVAAPAHDNARATKQSTLDSAAPINALLMNGFNRSTNTSVSLRCRACRRSETRE